MLINLQDLINKYNLIIKGVIHVGAHTFEEKPIYDKLNVPVYWFEANKELIKKHYFNRINEFLYKDQMCFLYAISDYIGTGQFYVTNNKASSSLLKLKKHKVYYPKIKEEKEITVDVRRLDCFTLEANFLNLDIQGAELRALKGATQTLKGIDYIYTEVNTEPLYEDCCLMSEIDTYLQDFKRVETKLIKKGWGDALYIKKKLLT
jgi:FkbM family methyltransferase